MCVCVCVWIENGNGIKQFSIWYIGDSREGGNLLFFSQFIFCDQYYSFFVSLFVFIPLMPTSNAMCGELLLGNFLNFKFFLQIFWKHLDKFFVKNTSFLHNPHSFPLIHMHVYLSQKRNLFFSPTVVFLLCEYIERKKKKKKKMAGREGEVYRSVMNVGHEKVEHMNSPNGVKLITWESLSDSLLPKLPSLLPLNSHSQLGVYPDFRLRSMSEKKNLF